MSDASRDDSLDGRLGYATLRAILGLHSALLAGCPYNAFAVDTGGGRNSA